METGLVKDQEAECVYIPMYVIPSLSFRDQSKKEG